MEVSFRAIRRRKSGKAESSSQFDPEFIPTADHVLEAETGIMVMKPEAVLAAIRAVPNLVCLGIVSSLKTAKDSVRQEPE